MNGITLVHKCGSRWKTKGAKHIKIRRHIDKQQINIGVSFAASGKYLPFQATLKVITNKNLPKLEGRRLNYEYARWNLTFNHNHWSTLDTCKEFMEKILLPYKDLQVKNLNLLAM